jgi:hypothetical protein
MERAPEALKKLNVFACTRPETDRIAVAKCEVFAHFRGIVRYVAPDALPPSGRDARRLRGRDSSVFSKARLDTLSDGIFGVAMTLLTLDVRLPPDFQPRDSAELLQGIANLWPKFPPCDIRDTSAIPHDAVPYLKLPPETKSVSIELTYRDGSVSEIKSFRR